MRISDWSSDVCSSDLIVVENASLDLGDDGMLTGSRQVNRWAKGRHIHFAMQMSQRPDRVQFFGDDGKPAPDGAKSIKGNQLKVAFFFADAGGPPILIKTGLSAVDVPGRSEEHTSELQSLMRIS